MGWVKKKALPLVVGAAMTAQTVIPASLPEKKDAVKEKKGIVRTLNDELFTGEAEAHGRRFSIGLSYGNFGYGGYPYYIGPTTIVGDPFFAPFYPYFSGPYGYSFMGIVDGFRSNGYNQQDIQKEIDDAKNQGKLEAQVEFLEKRVKQLESGESALDTVTKPEIIKDVNVDYGSEGIVNYDGAIKIGGKYRLFDINPDSREKSKKADIAKTTGKGYDAFKDESEFNSYVADLLRGTPVDLSKLE